MRFAAFPLLPLLAACSLAGGFPSLASRPAETPRALAAPGAGAAPTLSDDERRNLAADLLREGKALADARTAIAEAAVTLDRELARPDVARRGSAAWSDAQMQLSRLDVARLPLDDLRARLAPLRLLVDSLGADDPDRRAVERLAGEAAEAAMEAQRTLEAAGRVLGG